MPRRVEVTVFEAKDIGTLLAASVADRCSAWTACGTASATCDCADNDKRHETGQSAVADSRDMLESGWLAADRVVEHLARRRSIHQLLPSTKHHTDLRRQAPSLCIP